MSSLKLGGVWCVPIARQVYEKTGGVELTLLSEGSGVSEHLQDEMRAMIRTNLRELGGDLVEPE